MPNKTFFSSSRFLLLLLLSILLACRLPPSECRLRFRYDRLLGGAFSFAPEVRPNAAKGKGGGGGGGGNQEEEDGPIEPEVGCTLT